MCDNVENKEALSEESYGEYFGQIEAILFASGESVSYAKLSAVLELPVWELLNVLNALKERYNECHFGTELIMFEQSAQICTRIEYADIIKKALADRGKGQLSKAAFEVLSIIAYKQPTTKAYIEQVRGVESSNTVNLLCEKGLIECCGRLDVPGRPFTYRTTDNFLRVFGLTSVDDLPPLESFADDDSFDGIEDNSEAITLLPISDNDEEENDQINEDE